MAQWFSWHLDKATGNVAKHGVSFEEAMSAFGDLLSIVIADPDHSGIESRFVLIGLASTSRLLVVAFAERGDNIRIINARLATRRERIEYEEGT